MANEATYDCIIVGQGLAGTCLAFTLLQEGKKILVIDNDGGKKCSAVAAGTYNPVVFRTYTSVWKANELLPFLEKFYNEMGVLLRQPLLVDRAVLKRLKSEEQRQQWLKKSVTPEMSAFMDSVIVGDLPHVNSEFGFGRVRTSGSLKVNLMLRGFREYLKHNSMLLESTFDFDQLRLNNNACIYHDLKAHHIIFCQGHENSINPFFQNLPFRQTKGEVLIIDCPELNSKNIIHDGINIVPLEGNHYWVGATFDWDDDKLHPTLAKREKLVNHLDDLLKVPYKIADHIAGIRPTVRDRRPLLGNHFQYRQVSVFNGLGTRGVMLAPYFAKELTGYLFRQQLLHPEVDIARFNAKA